MREAASQTILLLDHPDHGHAEQALELVKAHDTEFRVVVLSELFARGYRCAPAAILVSAGDAARAHAMAIRLTDWALESHDASAAAVHAAKRLRESAGDDFASWSKLLLRVLDGTVFDQLDGPTYRDLLPEPPPPELAPSCAEAGVLGVLPAIIGSIQALEAIKLLLDLGDSLRGRLLAFDALEMTFREYKLNIDPANEVTHANRDLIKVADLDGLCAPQLSTSVN